MVNKTLMEEDFFKKNYNKIIKTIIHDNGVIEYAVDDSNGNDSIKVYQFRNKKQISIEEYDKAEYIDDSVLSSSDIKALNKLSKAVTFLMYGILIFNLKNKELLTHGQIVSALGIYTLTLYTTMKYKFSGLKDIYQARYIAKVKMANKIPVILVLSTIAFMQGNYWFIALYIFLGYLGVQRHLVEVIKCTGLN